MPDKRRTHGKTKHPLYPVWASMKNRCYNENDARFSSYGGRGIRVSKKWCHDFQSFYDWAISSGYKKGLSIERMNVHKGYTPSNCTWIPLGEQTRNKTNTLYVVYKNNKVKLMDLCEEYDIDLYLVRDRLVKCGWTIEKAIKTPKQNRGKRDMPRKPVKNKKTKRTYDYFIGLDLSLTGTGVVVLDHEGKLMHHVTLKSKLKGMPRLDYIRGIVSDVTHDYPKAYYCIENYSMGSRSGQAFSIGELGGVIKLLLHDFGIVPTLVSPSGLKKFTTGKGVCEKSLVLMNVFKNWGFEAPDDNQADAFGLAQVARALKTRPIKLTAPQKEVLRAITNPPEKKKKK